MQTLDWEDADHYFPSKGLHFILGECNDYLEQLNGHYFDASFFYTGRNYLETKYHVENYLTKLPKPMYFLPPDYNEINLLDNGIRTFSEKDTEPNLIEIPQVMGISEYSIYGWAKWN